MKLLEYQAQELFRRSGIPVMNGVAADEASEAVRLASEAGLAYPVVVKAQVPIGGRGKAGGIRFAETPEEMEKHASDLLGSELRGFRVGQVYIVEKSLHKAEYYLSIMLDRISKKPLIMFSACGGVDIEQTAKEDPSRIIRAEVDPLTGIGEHLVWYLLSASGLDLSLKAELSSLLKSMYRLFMDHSCMLLEINPLVRTAEDRLLALDAKVEIDDSALFRLPDVQAYKEKMENHEPLVKEAASFNFLYIPLEKAGSIGVMSNGSGMLMSCIDLISKEGMQVSAALDLGGGATADRIREAVRILFSTPGNRAVLINIFGGITRCDEVAEGVRRALEDENLADRVVIIRMEGTNKEKGLEIIQSIEGRDICCVPGLLESVQALCERRGKL